MSDIKDVYEELDPPDDSERKVQSRRQFMYSVKALAAAAKVERIFVNHPAFKAALEGCDRVFQLSRELSIQQGAIVVGPTGAGKTALIKHFCASLPDSTLFERGMGALAVRLPARPNVGHLIGALLRQIRYPFPHVNAHSQAIKRGVLIEALRQKGCRLLFIDEAQHLHTQYRLRSRNVDGTLVSECLREFMDEVPLALVLVGTPELMQLPEIDRQLDNRLSARFELMTFRDDALWRAFLRAFSKQDELFDLRLLAEEVEAKKLHAATDGNLRQFKRLVVEAVLVAVDEGCNELLSRYLVTAFSRIRGDLKRPGNPYA